MTWLTIPLTRREDDAPKASQFIALRGCDDMTNHIFNLQVDALQQVKEFVYRNLGVHKDAKPAKAGLYLQRRVFKKVRIWTPTTDLSHSF